MAMFIPADKNEALQQTIADFTARFSMFMMLGFKDVVIEDAVEKREAKDEPERKLLEMPLPDWDLKAGFLMKRGENRKNWNKRWFVAKNAADGFKLEYYTAEDLKTKKGEIGCAGYRAVKDDKMKPNGITLVPDDEGRRTWFIHASSVEERDAWFSVFENACSYGAPATDPDPMVQRAFEKAFHRLKRSCGIWYWLRHDRSPPEMLARLLTLDLERSLLPDILANINDPTGGLLRSRAREMVRNLIAGMCFSACNAAWGSAKPAIDQMKSLFVEKVAEQIDPIVELQVSLKGKIVDAVSSVTGPAMTAVAENALGPVVGVAIEPILRAFQAGMRGFHAQAERNLEKLGGDAETREAAVRDMISDVSFSYWHESPMVEAYQIIRDLYDSTLAEVINAVPGVSAWRLIWRIDDGLRDLIRRAIYTLGKLIEEKGDAAAALTETMERFVFDAKLDSVKIVFDGLKFMVWDMVDETMISPAKDAISPISDSIPEVMKELVDPETLLGDVCETIVVNGIQTAADAGTKGANEAIDAWRG